MFMRLAALAATLFTLIAPALVNAEPATATERFLGKADAPITLVEYGSVACPICAQFHETVMPDLKAKYIATGKVKYIYRPMMTANAAVASAGHLLAECAGDDKYFQVIDAIMRAQPDMDNGGGPEEYANAVPVLKDIALSAGLTEEQFLECITDADGLQRLSDLNEQYLTQDGVNGTPTFFVNGKEVRARDLADFDAIFALLLTPSL